MIGIASVLKCPIEFQLFKRHIRKEKLKCTKFHWEKYEENTYSLQVHSLARIVRPLISPRVSLCPI
jgi:hypothetical protein